MLSVTRANVGKNVLLDSRLALFHQTERWLAADELKRLLTKLRTVCAVVAIAGNHDRQLAGMIELRDSWEPAGFHFHHGHCAAESSGRLQIIGHHHPAATLTDGAGLRLKFPALVQQTDCWIMPAFSPWASGTTWKPEANNRIWLCTPTRILRLRESEVARVKSAV